MGWPSFLEDIQKVKDDVVQFQRQLIPLDLHNKDYPKLVEDENRRVACYKDILDRIIHSIDNLLSLATDPAIDLVQENKTLKSKLEISDAANKRLSDELALKADDANRLKDAIARYKELLTQERTKVTQLEKNFDRLAEDDFGAVVDRLYPPHTSKRRTT